MSHLLFPLQECSTRCCWANPQTFRRSFPTDERVYSENASEASLFCIWHLVNARSPLLYYFIWYLHNCTLPMQLRRRRLTVVLCGVLTPWERMVWLAPPTLRCSSHMSCQPSPHCPSSTGSHHGKMPPMWLRLLLKRTLMGGLLIDLCGQVLFMFIFCKHSSSIRKIDTQLQRFVQLPYFLLNIWWNPALRMQLKSTLTFAFPVFGLLEWRLCLESTETSEQSSQWDS